MPMQAGVGTALVVERELDGRPHWLMLKRRGSHGAGSWSVPGGWLDFGEEPQAGALREFYEEVAGVSIDEESVRYLCATNDVFEQEGVHSYCLWFQADYVSGEPEVREAEKAEAVEWHPRDELPEPYFLPLENYLAGKLQD